MATNPDKTAKVVKLSSYQLSQLAGGGTITFDGNTYTADPDTIYLVEDDTPDVVTYLAGGIPYLTSAPTEDNTNGRIISVVLPKSVESTTTRYEGYFYYFYENPSTP